MAATRTRPPTFTTSIDLPAATRAAMVDLCNQQLADSFDLTSQTKQAHWNVKGKDFIQLHLLFDTLAAEVLEHVRALVDRFAAYAASTRKAIDTATAAEDQSTADKYTEISRETDKSLWFLEAHLQG